MFQNKLFHMSLIILIAATLLGAVTIILWNTYLKTDVADAEAEPAEELSIDEVLERSVETEQITTNLYSDGFAQVRFRIQADSKEAKDELEKRMYQIEHIVIKTISSMTEDDIRGAEGLHMLETKIQQEMNELLDKGEVVKVLTTEKILDS